MDPLLLPLVRFDPPEPPEAVRRTKPLKLKPSRAVGLSTSSGAGAAGRAAGGGADDKVVPMLEDILCSILPPREVVDKHGAKMLQPVSSQPATRLDVIHLQETLDNRLVQRQARDNGICAVRSSLYSETFDELIRQITVNCPERGLLLLRVRDESRMTLAAHRALFENSTAFSVRKTMIAEQGLPEMRAQIAKLEKEKALLEIKVQELQARCEGIEKREQENRIMDEKKHADEVNYFRKTNHQLTTHLKTETEKANSRK